MQQKTPETSIFNNFPASSYGIKKYLFPSLNIYVYQYFIFFINSIS